MHHLFFAMLSQNLLEKYRTSFVRIIRFIFYFGNGRQQKKRKKNNNRRRKKGRMENSELNLSISDNVIYAKHVNKWSTNHEFTAANRLLCTMYVQQALHRE